MGESISSKTIWDSAAKAGLALGGISIAYYVVNNLLSATVLGSLLGLLLWIVKFTACIYLMKFFMVRFAARNQGVTNNISFKYGVAIALTSAILYSAFYLLYTTVIFPDLISDSIGKAMEAYSSALSSSQIDELENMSSKLPTYTFFINLIYCFLFGTVLSSIFSRNIPPRNPFESPENNIDEQ